MLVEHFAPSLKTHEQDKDSTHTRGILPSVKEGEQLELALGTCIFPPQSEIVEQQRSIGVSNAIESTNSTGMETITSNGHQDIIDSGQAEAFQAFLVLQSYYEGLKKR